MALCLGLSGYLPSNVYGDSASEELQRAVAHILSAEQGLAAAKASALATFKTLQSRAIKATEESEKWTRLANLEGDARMKPVYYGFRDAFSSHSTQLTDIVRPLRELGVIGEDLEMTLKPLQVLRSDLERIVRGGAAPVKTRSLLTSTKQGLHSLLLGLTVSMQKMTISRDDLIRRAATIRKHDENLRQLLAFSGDPKDRIGRWEQQVVQTEIDNNAVERQELANVVAIGVRIEDALAALINATKALQLVATGI